MNPFVVLPLVCMAGTAMQRGKPVQSPPGMVLLEGGRAMIGTPSEWIEEMGRENIARFNSLCCQSPQHEVQIDSFYLMTTEVTNEQYEAFVRATGSRPPSSWGLPSIEDASRMFAEQADLARQRTPPLEVKPFDEESWWSDNWRSCSWAVPEGQETDPVVDVDFEDASAYARWAGMRLPTEFEFQYAGRGRSRADYPWGDHWDPARCGNVEHRSTSAFPVGSFPGGRTKSGLYDLIGNVWEWTSSPFIAYPRYEALKIEIREHGQNRIIEAIPEWDSESRVAMGGSWLNEQLACRLATRRSTVRSQRTNSLGFRCAASVQRGVDMACAILREDHPPAAIRYAPELTVAADQWKSRPGSAQTTSGGLQIPVASYAIIESYDFVLFIPVQLIDLPAVKDLRAQSIDHGPIHVGILSSSKPSIAPPLEPGTHLVAFRGGGEPREDGTPTERAPPLRLPQAMDPSVDNLIFYDRELMPVAFLPLPRIDAGRPSQVGVGIVGGAAEARESGPVEAGQGVEPFAAPLPVVAKFRLAVNTRVSNLAFLFDLPVQFEPGLVGADWRH